VGDGVREGRYIELVGDSTFWVKFGDKCMCEDVAHCVHGGTLWLDPPVSIDTALIACITGLPKAGEDPTILFNKEGERALSESMKEKFQTFRGKRGLDVKNINDNNVRFATQVLDLQVVLQVSGNMKYQLQSLQLQRNVWKGFK
jgi:hypothetical protein